MSSGAVIKTCFLLAVITHAHGQYIDFFNSFLQPFTTSKPRNEATKRPDTKHGQTNKQKYQDTIFFETDEFLKQREPSRTVNPFNVYSTTAKPRRKSKTSTTSQSYSNTTNKPKSVNSNKIINNNRNEYEVIRNVNDNNNSNKRVNNNARRIDNNNNANDNVYNNYNSYGETTKPNVYDNRQTTQRTTNFNVRTTHRPNRPAIYNKATTKNPLLNRPGVKPAVVDDNRPPITNRPVYDRPLETTYKIPRPVNTRPPFETERPISTGVARPISGAGPSNEDTEIDIELGPDEDEMGDAEKRRLYDICEQKCDEYKSMRVRKVVALPLGTAGARGSELNVSSCAPEKVPLILGGQLARIETFPHMALLGWRLLQGGGYAWKCGGSLVSERYVLTAGHCTYHDKDYNVVSGPPAAAQLGSSIYNDRSATVARVSLVVRHPKYKLRRSYHDIALLKLAVAVTFSETIMPACLGEPPAVGEPLVATGWGKTEFGGDSSIQLRSVSFPVWGMDECRDIWGTSLKLPRGPLPDNQICAGDKRGGKDTCQGDSGGPAQVRDGCAWRVVAVTSVGRSCGAPDTPALYARVPRAFVARQVFTNIKTERDGNNQYGNQGINVNNNNGNRNNNWSAGNNNGAGNNNRGVVNQNRNPDTANTGQFQNNNGQNYNNAGTTTNNNNQYYNSQVLSTSNRDTANDNGNNYSNNRNNNWGGNADNNNNRYNQNNNGNVNQQTYYDNGRTTNGYNQNSYGQTGYNNERSQSGRDTENLSDMRNYGTQSYKYNDNGSTDNNENGYSIYAVASRPWWNS